ncbi:hypothetical protein [Galactobacillus timonensis]|uniref:hypothetical protein n=1 Tax=Galactobacillus timonensis TaxID=2041840 RepID=UPI0024092A25|nr:hypothetical protein [Galactobacillus timonensis]MDD6369156.1 hypothetical protein [Galactobacillus timonensis]
MRNAEWMIKNGMSFENLHIRRSDNHYYEIGYYVNDYDRIYNESEDAILEHGNSLLNNEGVLLHWLQSEHKEPILDEAERNYLSAVIRPFRDDVRGIRKMQSIYRLPDDGKEYIKICMRSDEEINLPYFRKGTMYKGMELGRKYTLEELGL